MTLRPARRRSSRTAAHGATTPCSSSMASSSRTTPTRASRYMVPLGGPCRQRPPVSSMASSSRTTPTRASKYMVPLAGPYRQPPPSVLWLRHPGQPPGDRPGTWYRLLAQLIVNPFPWYRQDFDAGQGNVMRDPRVRRPRDGDSAAE
eukprot:8381437-Pyramimonas_sp.AAC.1